MKNIINLYRKQFAESRMTSIIYPVLLLCITFLVCYLVIQDSFNDIRQYLEEYSQHKNESAFSSSDPETTLKYLCKNLFSSLLLICAVSLIICIHWGIRHFNHSSQQYHYNTLPVTTGEKAGYIFSYVYIVLPLLHLVILWISITGAYSLNLFSGYSFPGANIFFLDVFRESLADIELRFGIIHFPFFMIAFTAVALFFNRMGFLKTLVAVFILSIIAGLFFIYFNFKASDIYGDFGDKYSLLNFPGLYRIHYIAMAIFCLVIMGIITRRLKDKNY